MTWSDSTECVYVPPTTQNPMKEAMRFMHWAPEASFPDASQPLLELHSVIKNGSQLNPESQAHWNLNSPKLVQVGLLQGFLCFSVYSDSSV